METLLINVTVFCRQKVTNGARVVEWVANANAN